MKKSRKAGSLILVGTGIKGISQMTLESRSWIVRSECVMFCVHSIYVKDWIQKRRPEAINLGGLYSQKLERSETYRKMALLILKKVREGKQVCAVFYGHPGVFVRASHLALQMAKSEGFSAKMLPGVSAEACLFADLGINPGYGCQSFEATRMLIQGQKPSPDLHTIIWQVGTVGEAGFDPVGEYGFKKIKILTSYLKEIFSGKHKCILYTGPLIAEIPPFIQELTIQELPLAQILPFTTLYIPPVKIKTDTEMISKLGLDKSGSRSYPKSRLRKK